MIFYGNKYLDNNLYEKLKHIKRLNLYFILVTTFSCLMFFFIIVQLINATVIYSISPHKEDAAAVSQSLLNYSVAFSFLSILFFILILVFLISSYVFMFIGINKISQIYIINEYYQKDFDKIKLFAILSIFTLGLIFPWIIIHKLKKLKNALN